MGGNYNEKLYTQICKRPISQFTVESNRIIFVPNGEGSNDLYICKLDLSSPQILMFNHSISRYSITNELLVVGLENGNLMFYQLVKSSSSLLYRNYRHRSSITLIAIKYDLIISTCHDELIIWTFSPMKVTLLLTVPLIYFEPGAKCSLITFENSTILLISTSSKVYTFEINDFIKTSQNFTLSPLPLILHRINDISFDPFQLVVFNFNQLLCTSFFHSNYVI